MPEPQRATLQEQVDMVAACQIEGIIDRPTAEHVLVETTGLSSTLVASMLERAVLDLRAAEKHRDDWVPLRDWDGRWTR